MQTIRRVVTGHREDGKSVIASDQEVSAVEYPRRPGSSLSVLWGADETLTYPDSGALQSLSWHPTARRLRTWIRRPLQPKSSADFPG